MSAKAPIAISSAASVDAAATIAVDVMGGDDAPGVVLEGVIQALAADPLLSVVLAGPTDVIEAFAAQHPERLSLASASEVIGMNEHPAHAVRVKKDSSIVVGCRLVRDGRADGFFSAGSTGACMAAATLYIGRVKGIARPAIASVLPAPAAPVILTDVGANADVKPEYLVQFAQMASVYAQRIMGVEHPRIGLLNIGEEETKGSTLAQEAFGLMREQVEGFCGNAEGTDILTGRFDVIVTDGFTGNVTLKTIEGTAGVLFGQLKEVFTATPLRKLAAAAVMPGLRKLKSSLSAEEVGGAPLLGLKGSCIIGHGSSSARAVANGIAQAARCAREQVADTVAQAVARAATDELPEAATGVGAETAGEAVSHHAAQ
ncbi:MAG: phosphate acyltransferase PlsX [Coriobacteriales bacterium]|jgi:glycerol-3-phosphate acyltransferase PlsX|nr:phosphate acyltransferase PlsX [Coriobacteriales bacterium]